jgi:hypothetical protein
MDIINKKFSIDSTSLKIDDNEYGWSIKKGKGKTPNNDSIYILPYKCTAKDEQGKTCTEFSAEKAKWEEHVAERRGYHSSLIVICNGANYLPKESIKTVQFICIFLV